MLPWQLVEAHEPGPVYFPTPSVAVARSCDKVVDGKMQPEQEGSAQQQEDSQGLRFELCVHVLFGKSTLPQNLTTYS